MEDMGNYGYTLFRTIPGKIIITVTGGEGGNQPDGTSFINAILISPIE